MRKEGFEPSRPKGRRILSPLRLPFRRFGLAPIPTGICYTETMREAVERLRFPRPGGAIAAARDFGVDLTLLMERLQRTPEQRLRDLQKAMENLEAIRSAATRPRESQP